MNVGHGCTPGSAGSMQTVALMSPGMSVEEDVRLPLTSVLSSDMSGAAAEGDSHEHNDGFKLTHHSHGGHHCCTHAHDHAHEVEVRHDHHHHHDEHCKAGHSHWMPHSHGIATHSAVRDEKKLALALLLYIMLAAGEAIGSLLSHSRVLGVEALHTLLDALTVLFAIVALRVARRAPNARATFGFARAEVLTALLSVLWLFTLMLGLIFGALRALAGFEEIAEVRGRIVMMTAGAALVTNVVVQIILTPQTDAAGSSDVSMNVKAARAHALADSLESFVALVIGAVLTAKPTWHVLDPVLSILVGLLVIAVNWKIVQEAWDILMEFAPRSLDVGRLRTDLEAVEDVEDVEDLHVWTIGLARTIGAVRLRVKNATEVELVGAVRAKASALMQDRRISHFFIETTEFTDD
mmetsp:Transcript_40248/g.98786  ORF Transcript_40248/g.98786 Transcript_40248/m.98786 type:complete len:408 (-) Transcript_40248:169-1392(-)